MAMTACWECKKDISDTAATCPHCGAERKAAAVNVIKEKKGNTLLWIIGVPVALFLLFLAYGASIPEYKAAAMQRRDICEKLAAPYQRGECDRIYAADIAKGQASPNTQNNPGPPVSVEEINAALEDGKKKAAEPHKPVEWPKPPSNLFTGEYPR
jgi:hypothetical protein